MDNFLQSWQDQQMSEGLRALNDLTRPLGLMLSDGQIAALVQQRGVALRAAGRVEFGAGILKKLVQTFYDSPYLDRENYEGALTDLQESFYYFKNECKDTLTDDELLSYMRGYFDGVCQGSLDYLNGTSLDELCRSARNGFACDE